MNWYTVAECNLSLLENKKYSDVVFIVGEARKRISSHKVHLMARSSVFETMFAKRWKSSCDGEIEEVEIPDVKPSVFRQFLQYMYGDKLPTEIDEAIEIIYVADKYQVISLLKQCENFIESKMEVKDAIRIHQVARFYNLSTLKKKSGDFMAKEFSRLIDHPSFKLMDEETLLELLPNNDLLVDEFKLFNALIRWSEVQLASETPAPSDQRRVLKKILPLLRFPSMNIQDFEMNVIPKGILTLDESTAICTYINSEASKRTELRASLGFPWQPRPPQVAVYLVELYETDEKNQKLINSNDFKEVTNHIDKNDFSFAWSIQSLVSGMDKTAFITSITLRGPNYSFLANEKDSWRLTNSWKITLKLEKLVPSCMTIWDILSAPSQTWERTIDNLEIFGNKDTVVDINPPFDLKKQFKYRISVSYSDSVYLPDSSKVDGTKIQDCLTSTRTKNNLVVRDSDGIPELKLGSLSNPSGIDYFGFTESDLYSNSDDDDDGQSEWSHCIRSIEIKVHNY